MKLKLQVNHHLEHINGASNIEDADGLGDFSYEWYGDGLRINGTI